MKTAGQILQTAREAARLDIEDVTRITKIRSQFLRSLEADDYGRLPNATVTRGFVRNYAEFLNLNPLHLLAVFRRDFVENRQGQIVPRGMVEPVNKISFWTPRTTVIAVVSLIFTVFTAYLLYQYQLLTGPPVLEVTAPAVSATVAENTVEITGKTDPEATLSVNGELVALDKGGEFFLRVSLIPGPNMITITATAKSGKKTVVTRDVNRVDNL